MWWVMKNHERLLKSHPILVDLLTQPGNDLGVPILVELCMWDAPSLIVIDDFCNLLCLAIVLSIVEVSFK